MKEQKATYETVAAAAQALQSENLRPSVRAVIARLGGGSPNSVVLHLRRWNAERPTIEARKSIVVDEKIGALIAEQIDKAAREARTAADAERAETEADMLLVSTSATEVASMLETAQEQLETLKDQQQRNAGVIEQLQADIESIKFTAAQAIDQARTEAGLAVSAERVRADAERKRGDDLSSSLTSAELKAARLVEVESLLKEAITQRDASNLLLATVKVHADRVPSLESEVSKLREQLTQEREKRANAEREAAASAEAAKGALALHAAAVREAERLQELGKERTPPAKK